MTLQAGLTPASNRTANAPNLAARSDLRNRLERAARRALPGHAAQRRFEPPWGFGRHFGPPPHDAVPAAVTVLVYPHEGRLWMPLTLRHAAMKAHAGQVSFPGGRIDPGESDVAAALRELHEELGIGGERAEPVAALTPLYIFGTNFFVRPWLAWAERRPEFVVNGAEVAELLEMPLDALGEAAHQGRHRKTVRGIDQEVPHLSWQGQLIWGATAMILGEVAALYERISAAAETTP